MPDAIPARPGAAAADVTGAAPPDPIPNAETIQIMIRQITWLEKHDRQLDAAALRRDVNEAQAHITRLHRRYLGGDVQASQPVR
jgi:hypothetical protein